MRPVASFQHFSPGFVLLGLAENGQRIPLPKWYGKMAISNASLAASAASADGNYSLQLTQAQVLLEPNIRIPAVHSVPELNPCC